MEINICNWCGGDHKGTCSNIDDKMKNENKTKCCLCLEIISTMNRDEKRLIKNFLNDQFAGTLDIK